MQNPLRILVKMNDVSGNEIAQKTGLSKSMVYRAIRKYSDNDLGIPPDVKIGTITKIVYFLDHDISLDFPAMLDAQERYEQSTERLTE